MTACEVKEPQNNTTREFEIAILHGLFGNEVDYDSLPAFTIHSLTECYCLSGWIPGSPVCNAESATLSNRCLRKKLRLPQGVSKALLSAIHSRHDYINVAKFHSAVPVDLNRFCMRGKERVLGLVEVMVLNGPQPVDSDRSYFLIGIGDINTGVPTAIGIYAKPTGLPIEANVALSPQKRRIPVGI